MTRRRRSGFTFIELLVSMTIVGILASVAIPKYRDVKRMALSAQLIGDFDVVRNAALTFYVDSSYFPREASMGQTPRNMGRYLPETFEFTKQHWRLDYEHIVIRPSRWFAGLDIVGISARTTDPDLRDFTMKRLGPGTTVRYGSKVMYVISGL